jgi:hypothetical protein
MAEPRSPAEVLIVGGGVAALETLMALRDLAGDRVRVTLVAAEPDFVYRPMAVAEPFGLGGGTRCVDRRDARRERLVALPLVRGPQLDGVPSEPDFGFVPVDRHGRVDGLDGVYAAGDATNFPIKQGGLAAQQADAVSEHVAARHGARLDPPPFRPVLRGLLFAGGPDRYLRADDDAVAAQPLWWPPTKIAGRYLAPYLYEREPAAAPGPAPEGFVDLEVPLETTDATLVGR